jgi:solute carrier family 35 protein E2
MVSGKTGLSHPTAIFLMVYWYLFSACNLFANKYVISYLKGDPALLGEYIL